MNSFLHLLALLMLSTINMALSTSSPFAGDWKLTEAYDENDASVSIPSGSWFLKIQQPDDEDDSHLRVGIKIGNNMRGQITILGDGESDDDEKSKDVSVSGLMSTMMMPAEHLYRLEIYLSKYLPKTTKLELDDETGTLVFEGEGKLVCTK